MFGFLYFLFMGAACIGDSIKNEWRRLGSKVEAEKRGEKEYVDSRGRTWYGDILCYHNYINGCHVLQSKQTGQIIRNYTAEEFAEKDNFFWSSYYKQLNIAKQKGSGYFLVTSPDKRDGLYETSTGKRIYLCSGGNSHSKYYYEINSPEKSKVNRNERIDISQEEWEHLGGLFYDGKFF